MGSRLRGDRQFRKGHPSFKREGRLGAPRLRFSCAMPTDKVRRIVPWFAHQTAGAGAGMVDMRQRSQSLCVQTLSVRMLCVAAALVAGAPAARSEPGRVAEIAGYQGPDREQRLVEGAKKEKELTFYSSVPPEDIAALVAAFDKKYGVKVRVWRADSEGFLQRIVSEARARRFEVDVMAGSSSALEPLYRENLLQEVKSPNLADL